MNCVQGAFDVPTGSIRMHTNNRNPFLKNWATPSMKKYVITIRKGFFENFSHFGISNRFDEKISNSGDL